MWNTFAAVEALPMKLGQKEKQENVTVMNFLAHHLWPLQKASKLIVQWDMSELSLKTKKDNSSPCFKSQMC